MRRFLFMIQDVLFREKQVLFDEKRGYRHVGSLHVLMGAFGRPIGWPDGVKEGGKVEAKKSAISRLTRG